MKDIECSALEDGERCRSLVEEGELCPTCAAWEEEQRVYWRFQYEMENRGTYGFRECCGAFEGALCAPDCDGGDAEYRREMIDAGRGHLLGVGR